MTTGGGSQSFREALRLFLQTVCCDLCRFEHVATEHIAPEEVVIRQEVAVGPSAFADIQVTPGELSAEAPAEVCSLRSPRSAAARRPLRYPVEENA